MIFYFGLYSISTKKLGHHLEILSTGILNLIEKFSLQQYLYPPGLNP